MNRATRGWVLVILMVVVILSLRATSKQTLPDHPYFERDRPLVIAHRGGAGLRPENTLIAFRHASRLGVDVLEFDVRQTLDDQLVLMHDDTVDRTTNGSGAVAEMTYAQLSQLDAAYHWLPEGQGVEGSIPPYQGDGIQIPKLSQVLEEFPEYRLNIEIKESDELIAEATCELVKSAGAEQRVLIASEHASSINAFRLACPNTPTATSYSETVGFVVNQTVGLLGFYHPRAYALEIPPSSHGIEILTKGRVEDAAAQGMHVLPWTINDQQEMRRIIDLGVTGIITDYPDRMLQLYPD
ncbi:MAG: glycerophosphodiester phosphodiesterase [Pseudomonadales bacterium]